MSRSCNNGRHAATRGGAKVRILLDAHVGRRPTPLAGVDGRFVTRKHSKPDPPPPRLPGWSAGSSLDSTFFAAHSNTLTSAKPADCLNNRAPDSRETAMPFAAAFRLGAGKRRSSVRCRPMPGSAGGQFGDLFLGPESTRVVVVLPRGLGARRTGSFAVRPRRVDRTDRRNDGDEVFGQRFHAQPVCDGQAIGDPRQPFVRPRAQEPLFQAAKCHQRCAIRTAANRQDGP